MSDCVPGTDLDRAGSRLLTPPFILRRCQQPKVHLTHYLHIQIDLSEPISIKSGSPPWESFGRHFGPPWGPQVTPREAQVSPKDPTGSPQEASGGNFHEASGSPSLYTNSSVGSGIGGQYVSKGLRPCRRPQGNGTMFGFR